jgi:integrase
MKKKAVRLEKYVAIEKGSPIVRFPWPDVGTKRRTMPNVQKANEISLRFQASLADGTWPELRRKLFREDDVTLMTFEKFGEIYLNEYVRSFNGAYDDKASRIRILGHKLNQLRLDALSKPHVTAFINWRKSNEVKNATINRDLTVLAHMLDWGVSERYLERNPIPDIQKLKEVKWEGPRPTDEIVNAVFEKLDQRVVPLYTFIRWTGCRREEALSLKHYQIDWERREVLFHDNTKNGKPRRVPLEENAIWALSAQPKASEYVFYHPESLTRWDTCRDPWEDARASAGYPWLRVHDLRHAYAIKLAERGCPMHFISEILGHHSLEFTRRRYARFSPESASNAVRSFLEGSQNVANLSQLVN